MAGDGTFDRGVVVEIGEQLVEDGTVEHAATQILATGRHAAIDENHRQVGLCQPIGGGASGRPGADDDGVEGLGVVGHDARLECADESGHNLVEIADDAVIGLGENRRGSCRC